MLEYFKEFFKAVIKREQFRMYSRNVEREQHRSLSKAIYAGKNIRTKHEQNQITFWLCHASRRGIDFVKTILSECYFI